MTSTKLSGRNEKGKDAKQEEVPDGNTVDSDALVSEAPDHRSQGFPQDWSEVTSTGFRDVIRNMFAWFAEDVAGNVQESPNTAGDEDWRSVYRGGGAAGSTY